MVTVFFRSPRNSEKERSMKRVLAGLVVAGVLG
jgi:hypothetical protein